MDHLYQRQTYNYDLPESLVAQTPLDKRDHSKLLMANRKEILGHHSFKDLADLLPAETLIVRNNSKVIASRLVGKTEHGGRVEIFLLEPTDEPSEWHCLAKPLKKLKFGSKVYFEDDSFAEVTARPEAQKEIVPTIKIKLNFDAPSIEEWLNQIGHVPLPPYIERSRPKAFEKSPDRETYQTVYADLPGSTAAPTAGLHFTTELMTRLASRGIEFCETTLHVGSGTFLPVKTNDIRQHAMHSERYSIPKSTVEALHQARLDARPIIAVGTTSLRSLEAFAKLTDGNFEKMCEYAGKLLRTDIFIHPKEDRSYYETFFTKGMITNFHQPESSLIMFVSALMGTEHIKQIYKQAIEQEYRFFSYGDACFFWFEP